LGRVADYVIGVLEDMLGEPVEREKRIAWAAAGNPGSGWVPNGRRIRPRTHGWRERAETP